MLFRKKMRTYVSEIDKFLAEFDATHPKSASQLAEIKKYQRIYSLRDTPLSDKDDKKIWEEF